MKPRVLIMGWPSSPARFWNRLGMAWKAYAAFFPDLGFSLVLLLVGNRPWCANYRLTPPISNEVTSNSFLAGYSPSSNQILGVLK